MQTAKLLLLIHSLIIYWLKSIELSGFSNKIHMHASFWLSRPSSFNLIILLCIPYCPETWNLVVFTNYTTCFFQPLYTKLPASFSYLRKIIKSNFEAQWGTNLSYFFIILPTLFFLVFVAICLYPITLLIISVMQYTRFINLHQTLGSLNKVAVTYSVV